MILSIAAIIGMNWQLLITSEIDCMSINDKLDAAAELVRERGTIKRLVTTKVDGMVEVDK